MSSLASLDRDRLIQLLGAKCQQIAELEQQNLGQRQRWESIATKWHQLAVLQRDLGEWLVDQATDTQGRLVASLIDAGLGGEEFVPCSFKIELLGRNYRFDLSSTTYTVREVSVA